MQQLLSPDTFEFFVQYLLAGFVFMAARSRFIAGERPRLNEVLVESLILSLNNQVIGLATMSWIDPAWSTTRIVLPHVVQPAVLGALAGWIASMDAIPPGLRRLVMPTVRPVEPSLGFAFDQLPGPAFVILTFTDDKTVYGYFGENSLIGSSGETSSIFLEDLYTVQDDGAWQLAQPRRNGWITLSGIRSIEFIPDEEVQDAQDPV